MGNDGGSIPDRRDLVKNKPKAEQADKNNQTVAQWFFCALSKRELREPIVSCELGKLYNKDAIIEYLLDKSAYGDGEEICGHIRSLKDVKTLKLTRNPTETVQTDKDTGRHAVFICPLTLKEMLGATPFVYIATCGDVFSAGGLRAVSTTASTTPPPDASAGSTSSPSPPPTSSPTLYLCPQCGAKYDKTTDVRAINPPPEESQRLKFALEYKRALEPAKGTKKGKKRKAVADDTPSSSTEPASEAKRAKVGAKPSVHSSMASVNRKVAAELAEAEEKRKGTMSEAVASLYGSKNSKPAKETFLTMGTFTRYA